MKCDQEVVAVLCRPFQQLGDKQSFNFSENDMMLFIVNLKTACLCGCFVLCAQ